MIMQPWLANCRSSPVRVDSGLGAPVMLKYYHHTMNNSESELNSSHHLLHMYSVSQKTTIYFFVIVPNTCINRSKKFMLSQFIQRSYNNTVRLNGNNGINARLVGLIGQLLLNTSHHILNKLSRGPLLSNLIFN